MADVFVKICGITNTRDALLAAKLGARMIGLNFYSGSSRYISPPTAKQIVCSLPADVEPVGVFVNASVADIVRIAQVTGIRAVQLHGDETDEFCGALRSQSQLQLIKAVRTVGAFDGSDSPHMLSTCGAPGLSEAAACCADAILVDAPCSDYGGSGQLADWQAARAIVSTVPVTILAGGLNAKNVAAAIETVGPAGVDVCSGVESSPGLKDEKKMLEFLAAVASTQPLVREYVSRKRVHGGPDAGA